MSRYSIIFLLFMSNIIYSFYNLPYIPYKEGQFILKTNYSEGEPRASELSVLQSESDQSKKRLHYTDLTFAFKQFAVGLRAVPVRFSVLDKKFDITALGFNFYWRPDFLKFNKLLNSHIVLGTENIGITNDLNSSVFRYDIKTSFATLKSTPFKHFKHFNIYVSSLTNLAEVDKYITSYGISWEYPRSKFFIEKYYERLLISAEVNTSSYSKIGIMINPRVFSQRNSIPNDVFLPTFGINLTFNGFFMKPIKIIKPIKINNLYIEYMEKGFIAFYEEDYDKALSYYQKIIVKYPHFPLAHSRLGDIYYKLNMPNLAMKHWKKTLIYEPKNYKVLRATKQLEEDLAKTQRN